MKKKILFIFGTRPEYLKLYNLIKFIRKNKNFVTYVANTMQHSDLLFSQLKLFKTKINFSNKNRNFNSLSDTSDYLGRYIKNIIINTSPDLVIYQGDTLTTYLSSYYSNLMSIKSMHIEAGLRTYDYLNPWPEEGFRNSIKNFSTYHCAPTKTSYRNLISEKVDKKVVRITGNTIVDLLNFAHDSFSFSSKLVTKYKKYIYITVHRRENHGTNLIKFCEILKQISKEYQNINFILPVHSNPNIKKIIYLHLSEINNVYLIKPLNYIENLIYIKYSFFVISDSGGIQEEIATFKKRLLIYRKKTERPEILNSFGILVNYQNLKKEFNKATKLQINKKIKNPFGDGKASQKIYKFIKDVI